MAIEEVEDQEGQGREVGSQVSQSFGETNQNKNRRVLLALTIKKSPSTKKLCKKRSWTDKVMVV